MQRCRSTMSVTDPGFEGAAQAVEQLVVTGDGRLSDAVKLQLYGLYKQATIGDCNITQPAFYQFKEKQKWSSWAQHRGCSPVDAKQQYVTTLTRAVPDWMHKNGGSSTPRGQACTETADMQASLAPRSSAQRGFGPVFSIMQHQEQAGCDSEPLPPLHAAARDGLPDDVLLALMREKMDVNQQDGDGCVALHWAADGNHVEVIRVLAANGADLDAQDHDGATPLHYAALTEQLEAAACLVELGADVRVQDAAGQIAADICPAWQCLNAVPLVNDCKVATTGAASSQ